MNCIEGEIHQCKITKDEILKYKKFQDNARLHVWSEMAIQISMDEMQRILQEGNKRPAIEVEDPTLSKKAKVAEVHDTGEVGSVAVEREGGSAIVDGQVESEMVEEEEEEIGAVGDEIGVVGGDEKVEEVEEAIGMQGVGGAEVMEIIKVVEVKSSGDQQKNRTQDGPVLRMNR